MAISGGDGSIILTTKVDTKGLDASMAKMRQQAKGTGSAFEGLSNFIKIQETRLAALRQQYASYVLKNEEGSAAAKKLAGDIKNLSTSLAQNQARLNAASASAVSFGAKAKTAIAGVGASLKVLASYLIGIQTIFAVINFSKQAGEFATQTEASVQRLIDIYGSASKSVGDFIDQNARALGMSRAAAAEYASVYGNLFSVWADQETNAELTNQYLNTTAVVASKTGRTMQDVQERIRSGLLGNTEAVEDLGIFVNIKTIEMTEAFKRVADGRSWAQLNAYEQSQVRTLAILEQATSKYGSTVANTTALTRSQYQAAFEDFKNTWGQVVNKILIPVLRVATAVLNVVTQGLQVIAGLYGKTVETTDSFKEQDTYIGSAVDNQNDLTDAVDETAKAQEKSLAGFDKINKLTEESSSPTGDLGDLGGGGSISLPEMDYDNSFVDKINEDLVIIMGAVGVALVAIGLILLFHGNIAWGIGFIIAGAATLSATMATLKSDNIGQDVKDKITAGFTIIGIVAVVIGILLCFAQNWKLGIGLIALGATTIVGAISLNWNGIKSKVSTVFTNIKDWLKTWGLLVLGVVLCFTGVGIPLGIGLIKKGASNLSKSNDPNWWKIKEKLTTVFSNIKDWLKTYGLLILGVLLCFTGVGIGLGIALVKKGAKNLAEAKEINWSAMYTKITEKVKLIQDWLKTYGLLILGTLMCFTGIGIPLGLALIKKGITNLAKTGNPNWETIYTKITEKTNQIQNWLKTWGLLVLGILLCFTGVGIPLGMGLISKGASNLAESKNPLWDSMLTQIKNVWAEISTFWKNNIAPWFTKEKWSTLAGKCGEGLKSGFKNAINSIISFFETLINRVIEKFNEISFTVPDWVPNIGGKKYGVNISKITIPRLAKGAVIPPNREFLAVLGDQRTGTNVETPLKTMIEAFNIALDGRDNIGSGEQTIVVTLDGEVLFRNVVKKNKNYTIATGVSPLGI